MDLMVILWSMYFMDLRVKQNIGPHQLINQMRGLIGPARPMVLSTAMV